MTTTLPHYIYAVHLAAKPSFSKVFEPASSSLYPTKGFSKEFCASTMPGSYCALNKTESKTQETNHSDQTQLKTNKGEQTSRTASNQVTRNKLQLGVGVGGLGAVARMPSGCSTIGGDCTAAGW